MKPVQGVVYDKAWKLLEDPARWTQQDAARDAEGDSCNAYSDKAVAFCVVGALERVYCHFGSTSAEVWDKYLAASKKVRAAIAEKHPTRTISIFNDNHSHAEVLALLKELDV